MVLILIGIVHFILVLMVIMPALSPTGEHVMLNKGVGQKGRYTWLGSLTKEALQTIFTRLFYILQKVIFELGGAVYVAIILMVFLGLPLLVPEFFLPGLADLTAICKWIGRNISPLLNAYWPANNMGYYCGMIPGLL